VYQELPEALRQQVERMLGVIYARMQYAEGSAAGLDAPTPAGAEEEEGMGEFRKDLFVLLRTVARIDPAAACGFVHACLAPRGCCPYPLLPRPRGLPAAPLRARGGLPRGPS